MISNDNELSVTLERIRHVQDQLTLLRNTETNVTNWWFYFGNRQNAARSSRILEYACDINERWLTEKTADVRGTQCR